MKLKIEIEMDGSAFEESRPDEVRRILHDLAGEIIIHRFQGEFDWKLRDISGNTCGFAKVIK